MNSPVARRQLHFRATNPFYHSSMNARTFALLFIGIATAGGANAQQVLSYVASTPSVTAPSGSFTNWTKTLEVPRFDSSLGTLTEVRLAFGGTAFQSAGGENLGATGGNYSYSISTHFTLARAGGGSSLFTPAAVTLSGSGNLSPFDNTLDLAGTSGFRVEQTISRPGELTLVDSLSLSSYIGSGDLEFTATAAAVSSITGPGQFATQAISKASVSVAIDYVYTPIPEPGTTAALLGVSAFGLILLRRRFTRFDLASNRS